MVLCDFVIHSVWEDQECQRVCQMHFGRGFSNRSKRVSSVSGRAAASGLKVLPATGSRWTHAFRSKSCVVAATQGRPKGQGKLDPYRALFAEVIAQDGDITMSELSAILFDAEGVRTHQFHW